MENRNSDAPGRDAGRDAPGRDAQQRVLHSSEGDAPSVLNPGEVPDPDPETDRAERAAMMRRVRLTAIAAWAGFAVFALISRGFWAFLGLTCSALVAIINFLWLEGLVVKVLQPVPRVSAWRLGVRTLARFALFGVALTVALFIVRFDALSVLLGFSVIVVGIMGEAVRAAWVSLTTRD